MLTLSPSLGVAPSFESHPARDADRELISRAQRGDVRARERLVADQLRLVASIARRSALRGTTLEDAIHEGVLGLMEAIDRFDTTRENRFSTYAAFFVRDRVARHARESRQMVKAPSTRRARTVLRGHGRATRALERQLGRAPTRAEIAARLGVDEDDVATCEPALGRSDVALDAFEPGDHRAHVRYDGATPEDEVAEHETRRLDQERVSRALALLPARERTIVERRFLADEATTLADLGDELGVSRERARQLQEAACAKLRRLLAA